MEREDLVFAVTTPAFYQFELLLNSTKKSGMNVVEFLPLTKCLRICEMFSLIWSRSIKFSIVEEKLNVIKSIFYENGIIENHGMNTPSVEKDWNTFRCYFQILRKEFQLYPAWSDNDGIHAVLKTLGTDANNDILVDNNDRYYYNKSEREKEEEEEKRIW